MARKGPPDDERSMMPAQFLPLTYLPIKLSDAIRPATVGTFVPSHMANRRTAVDIIVYLHGNIIEACGTVPEAFLKRGIEYYWSTPFFKCLHEELEASNIDALLIAPTLGTTFGSSSPAWAPRYGNLNKDGQFDKMVQDTIAMLEKLGAVSSNITIGQIILAGHSAGGMPMKRILEAKNSLRSRIRECWGFECLYFGTDTWVEWLDEQDHRFMHYRQPSQMVSAASLLQQHAGFIDVARGKTHCTLVRDFWKDALENSVVLKPAVLAPSVPVAQAKETAPRPWWGSWIESSAGLIYRIAPSTLPRRQPRPGPAPAESEKQ